MKTIYLAGQNNFGNRGCEALVRSTVGLLNEHLDQVRVLVPSINIPLDSAQWPDAENYGVEFVPASLPPGIWSHWDRLCRRLPFLTHIPVLKLNPDKNLARNISRCDALLAIGGDNYSLDYDLASLFYFVGEAECALRLGKPALLWGASVGPFSRLPGIERQMFDHLRRLSLITVRESASMAYLKSHGITDNVMQVTDSAFTMQPEPFPAESFFTNPHGVLGLNLSPLIERILSRQGRRDVMRAEVSAFVRRVVKEMGLSVLLISHVVPLNGIGFGNDERTHREIADDLLDLGDDVRLAPNGLNAPQLKYLISQCRFFIGARTHATVAAMSTGVPVTSIAYSIKARGINRDLFGHERYMLPTESLSQDSLWQALAILRKDEKAIRAQLTERIPLWKDRTHGGAAWLRDYLSK